MIDWRVWIAFTITEAVLCLTPGPAVLLVLSQALGRGPGRALWSSLGVISANGAYFVVSAAGLGTLVLAWPAAFTVLRWAGAAYLVWLGISAFRGHAPVVAQEGPRDDVAAWRLFLNGFVLQGANPKALVFFTAILPQFVDMRRPVLPQLIILGVTSTVVEFFILLGYGALASRASRLARQPRYAVVVDRVAGVLLIAAGLGVAWSRP